ncbi:MAG: hypothetical protein D6761_00545 [Candidatus Dadabacteria bacterium]|nr:MAG: hypothetical protein D6761_00545 [Candidatus Dadabacteria bacterium]
MVRLLTLFMLAAAASPLYASEGAHGEAHGKTLLVYAVINFILFVGLIVWKMRKPVSVAVRNRYDRITTTLHKVEAERDALLAELEDAERRLADVDKEANELIEGLERAGRAQAEKLITDARAQADAARRAAELQAIAAERAASRELLERAAAELTAAARTKLEERVDSGVDRKYDELRLAGLKGAEA